MRSRTAGFLMGAVLTAAIVRPEAQSPQIGPARIDQLIAQMTLEEKVSLLHGDRDPENLGQAGYVPGVPRLGIPPMRLTDGPAGVRTGKPATALPAPVSMASTFSPDLARQYGDPVRSHAACRG
jgi:beta-glucosidase